MTDLLSSLIVAMVPNDEFMKILDLSTESEAPLAPFLCISLFSYVW
jgi:hypothetical protein